MYVLHKTDQYTMEENGNPRIKHKPIIDKSVKKTHLKEGNLFNKAARKLYIQMQKNETRPCKQFISIS